MKEINVLGITAYCDCYIADDNYFYLISISGRPMIIKAIGAALLAGRVAYIDGFELKREYGSEIKTLTHNTGGICHKVIYSPDVFKGEFLRRIVIGKDTHAAFEWIDSITTTPLKREWKEWLWENMLKVKRLHSYGQLGSRKFDEVYMLKFQYPDDIDDIILNAIREGQLS